MLIGDILLWVGSCGVTVALLRFRFRNRVFVAGGQTIMLSGFRPNSAGKIGHHRQSAMTNHVTAYQDAPPIALRNAACQ